MKNGKKVLVTAIMVFVLSGFVVAQVKIGVINPDKVIQNTNRGKDTIGRLDEIGKSYQTKINTMQNEIKALEKELLSPALNDETRQSKTLLMQDKQTKLKRYVEDSRRDFQVKYQQEMNKLRQEIMPVISDIGKSQGFTLILDISTAGIAYFSDTIDITDSVIKAYNDKSGTK